MKTAGSHDSLADSIASYSTNTTSLTRHGSSGGLTRFSKLLRKGGADPSTPPQTPGQPFIAPKSTLKSKVGQAYEALFEGNNPADGRGESFWKELWLLKVDGQHLRHCIDILSEGELTGLAPSITEFLKEAHHTACDIKEMPLRRCNAMDTIACFLWGVLGKRNWANFSIGTSTVLCGVANTESFFSELLLAGKSAVKAEKQDVALSAMGVIQALTCGHPDPSRNSLIEYALRHLADEEWVAFFKPFTSHKADAGSPPRWAPPQPHPILLRSLTCLAVLRTYSRFEAPSQRSWSAHIAPEVLDGMFAALLWAPHHFTRFYINSKLEATANSGLLGSIRWAVQKWYKQEEVDPMLKQFDCTLPDYSPIPAPLASAMCCMHELSATPSFVNLLLNREVATLQQLYGYLVPDGSLSGKPFSCGTLLIELFFLTSILTQGLRDTSVQLFTALVFRTWRQLLDHDTVISFLHTPLDNIRIPLAVKSPYGPWSVEVHHGSPIEYLEGAPEGLPENSRVIAGTLLHLCHRYIALNLSGTMNVYGYDAVFNVMNRLLVHQKATHVRVLYPWETCSEKVVKVGGLLSKEEVFNSPLGHRLLRRICTFIHFFLLKPALVSADSQASVLYELVRGKDTISALEKVTARALEGHSGDDPSSRSMLTTAESFLASVTDWIAHVNAILAERGAEEDAVALLPDIVDQVFDEEDTKPRHTPLWTMPDSLLKDIKGTYVESTRDSTFSRLVAASIAEAAGTPQQQELVRRSSSRKGLGA